MIYSSRNGSYWIIQVDFAYASVNIERKQEKTDKKKKKSLGRKLKRSIQNKTKKKNILVRAYFAAMV